MFFFIFLQAHMQFRCVSLAVGVWKGFLLSYAFYVKPILTFILLEEQLQTQIQISPLTEAGGLRPVFLTQTSN